MACFAIATASPFAIGTLAIAIAAENSVTFLANRSYLLVVGEVVAAPGALRHGDILGTVLIN